MPQNINLRYENYVLSKAAESCRFYLRVFNDPIGQEDLICIFFIFEQSLYDLQDHSLVYLLLSFFIFIFKDDFIYNIF